MKKSFFTCALALSLAGCSSELPFLESEDSEEGAIIIASASHEDDSVTRSMLDGEPDGTSVVGMLWNVDDELGVFAKSGTQYRYVKANKTDREPKSAFKPYSDGPTIPRYAYYPYSADNDGLSPTELKGIVPASQPMDDGTIAGDYKYGTANGSNTEGYQFEFRNLFSLVKADVDATGTQLEGETLKSVKVLVTRNGEPVNICGDFNFNAVSGTVTYGQRVYDDLQMTWENGKQLNGKVTGYISLFPTIQSGDELAFTVTTDKHVASFSVNSKVSFRQEYIYQFPLTLSGRELTITDAPNGTEPEPEPGTLSGTFTCATYNVDGLPNISGINKDGPQQEGTVFIATAANNSNWDFFGVSEDFEYHSTLLEGLTNYNAGTWRGTVTEAQLSSRADTDGLCLFWNKNKDIVTENESYIQFTHEYGGVTGGANTCIKKGFRYYLVTLKDGTKIDVYITHMNTYSSGNIFTPASNWLNAANGQLTEIADYIKSHQNGRPIVVMGDTNCRYTRHLIKQNLIDAINEDSNLEIVDPWCSLTWGNDFSSVGGDTYPLYGGKSIMVSDATGTNANTDVIISEADGGLQKGEIVDKIFYINCRDAKTQLKAKSYLRDTSFKKADGTPLADHYPVVVNFVYTTRK